MTNKIILIGIILLSFFLRIHNLQNIPFGFFCDEASIGYNAFLILTRGVDEFGNNFPLFFQAFGEYKSPIQIYSTIPFIQIFGINESSTRLTSAVFGVLGIFSIYLLTTELFKNHKNKYLISLVSAFFLTISPWHIHFSRIAFELTPYVFFTTIGLYFFLKSLYKINFFPVSILFFSLAIYTYFPARIFIPLFSLSLFFVNIKYFLKYKKILFFSSVLLIILIIPLMDHIFSSQGLSRWQQVNIFSHPPANQSTINHVVNNYLSHFSSDFLFLKGDIGMEGQAVTRHSVKGMGELYLFQLPLIIFGIIYLLYRKQKNTFIVLLIWIMFYPIGSMFTLDKSAQATRSIIGAIPFQILSATGIIFFFSIIKNQLLKMAIATILCLIVIFSFKGFLNEYFFKYPLYSSDYWGWQYGPREIMKYFLTVKDSYNELYMSGEFNGGDIFLKFYDPLNVCQNKCKIGDFWREPLILNSHRKQLFSLSPDYLDNSGLKNRFQIKHTIYYPDSKIAFLIGEMIRK